jgi:hypothetical protein
MSSYNREYYEKNKEKILESRRGYLNEYYQKNKEKLLEYATSCFFCDVCCCQVQQGNKNKHLKSKKHSKNLNKPQKLDNCI